jgi:trans-L-3-hydroxyproline dehydratase
VLLSNQKINIPGLGKINFDVAYGGAFYAFVDADNLGIQLTTQNFRDIIDKGMKIKRAVMNEFEIKHPFEDDLSFLYGTIFTGEPKDKSSFSRNVCVFAEGEVDRSPTGTGVSARMALHYKKNEIKLNKEYIIESIVDTKFTGKAISKTKFGKYDAVIPEVGGDAFITGKNEFYINPDDPLKEGFILR